MYSEQITPASWDFMNGQRTPTFESSRSSNSPPTPFNKLDTETNQDLFLINLAWPESPELFYTLAQDAYLVPWFQQKGALADESIPMLDCGCLHIPSGIYNDKLYSPSTITQMSYPQSHVSFQTPKAANNQYLSATSMSTPSSQAQGQPTNTSNFTERSLEFPSTLSPMEYKPGNSDVKKTSGSNADGGTYTCTYNGCTLRFNTLDALKIHKLDHRLQSKSSAGGSASSQAGPHSCKRINPRTNEPCKIHFSRPYDLTRHERVIHNARRLRERCHICEKGFGRPDALKRHLRCTHPSYNQPTKS